jgi:hypothetical protein
MKEIIHIGYSKTASSWFQKYYFPHIKNVQHIDKKCIKEKIIDYNSFNFNYSEIRDFFSNNYHGRIILSHENLIGPRNTGGFNGMATKEFGLRIKSVFPEAEIVIFIRNQLEIITSAYLQEIWNGSTYGVNSFLWHKNKNTFDNMLMFSFTYYEYDKLIRYYHELFGKNKVHIFLYEDFYANQSEFLEKFSTEFDLNIETEEINKLKYNTRIRKNLIHLVRFSNLFTNKNTVFKIYLMNLPYWFRISGIAFRYLNKFRIFGNHPSPVSVLGRENCNFISEYYKLSNKLLFDEFEIKSIKKYNYPL